MTGGQKVQIFLEDGLRESALARSHNFLKLLQDVLRESGHDPVFLPMTARQAATGKSLTHMKPPATPTGLVFRRVYHYPFWQIEQTDKRWDWDVAQAQFTPAQGAGQEARRFQRFWRNRLFGGLEATNGDAIYIPLQGKITALRSFQSCAPIEMVARVLGATDRPVVIGLHPNESYSDQELEDLKMISGRAEIRMGGMERALPACHAVVTENSSVAFNGFFFGKPAFLFGQIDFHHIGQQKAPDQLADALETPAAKPYAKYLHWFWQERSINAGRPDAKDKIRARLSRFDWF